MELGAFSVSLSVKDLNKSKTFYESMGFVSFGGDISQNWLIMKNKETIIGLFQEMFDKNILTFNPGWDQNAKNVDSFSDVREIQKNLKGAGIEILKSADEYSEGPASIAIEDPDGNIILIDQHR